MQFISAGRRAAIAVILTSVIATRAWGDDQTAENAAIPAPPARSLVEALTGHVLAYILVATIYAVIAASIIFIIIYLKRSRSTWSLEEALSEEVDFTDASGAKETRLVASTSRLIALFGLVALLSIYLGVGAVVIFDVATKEKMPDLTGLYRYFFVGLALFVPYTINQVRSAFNFLGK